MPLTITMPKLSPTMERGTLVKWHKREGDYIESGDVLFEVATDKATVEHTALDRGFLRKILVAEGQEASVNQPIAISSDTQDESIEKYIKELKQPKKDNKQEAVKEKKEVPQQKQEEGIMLQVTFEPEPPLEEEKPFHCTQTTLLASPLAKKIAKDKGIDLTRVKGSGPHGRVMSRDLDSGMSDLCVSFGAKGLPQYKGGFYQEEPLTPMGQAIGKRLQAAKMSIPHFYVQQDIDAHPLVALHAELKSNGLKVTLNDFIIRASALALKKHLVINSGFNSKTNRIIRFKTIDIAVAVTIPEGLITPILRHVDYKDLGEISTELKELALLAKQGKLRPEQYRGGSFTVSNLGMFGIHHFQAVINPPQAAILAVGSVRDCPVVRNGKVVAGTKMMLSLSSDHRVIHGVDAAQFLQTLQHLIENPALLLI